jgi:hypothetical protein
LHKLGKQISATIIANLPTPWLNRTVLRFIEEDPIRFSAGDANLYRYVDNSPVDAIDPLGLLRKGSYYTQDETLQNRFRPLDGGSFGGSFSRGSRGGGNLPTLPIPRSFPVNIYGYPNRGVFDGQDFYNPNKSRSNINTDLLTEEQDSVLRDNSNSKLAQFRKKLAPDPNSCDDPKRRCQAGDIGFHLGGGLGGQYATHATGSPSDYLVFSNSGASAFFDGKTPGTRIVWEAKLGQGYLNYDKKTLEKILPFGSLRDDILSKRDDIEKFVRKEIANEKKLLKNANIPSKLLALIQKRLIGSRKHSQM